MQQAKQFKVKGVEVITLPRLTEIQGERGASARTLLISRMRDNLYAIYAQATEAEIQDGVLWYARARGFCAALARTYKVQGDGSRLTVRTVAGVVAALSPNNSWARNQADTFTVLNAVKERAEPSAVKVCTYNRNKERAFSIARTGDLNVLGGDKVKAFADNIGRADSDAVTIDFHAYSAALGWRYTVATAKGVRPAWYEIVSEAYRLAALQYGLKPYEFQAVLWVTWRRLAGVHEIHG